MSKGSGSTNESGLSIESHVGGALKASKSTMTVLLDGKKHAIPFGKSFLATSPGVHRLSVYWRMQLPSKRCAIDVTVSPGEVVTVKWDVPTWGWQSGQLSIVEQ